MTRTVLASLALATLVDVTAVTPALAAEEMAEPAGKDPHRLPQDMEAGAPATPSPPPRGDVPYRTVRTRPMDAQPLASRAPEGWFTPPPVRIDVGPPRQVRTERLDATNQPHLTLEAAALIRWHVDAAGSAPVVAERLAPGAEVSDAVDLRPLPAEVLAQAPHLRGRAYVVAADDTIALVDPESRRVGQVLRRQ